MMPVLLLVVAHGRRGLAAADFPVLTPERWMSDLEKIAIRDQVKPGMFKHNAANF
jgi:predicted TIM-barrel fold metal-dependent hydrolase